MLTRDKYADDRDRILGAFYTGVVLTNYSESCNEDLTVDATLKHFVNSKKDFKGLFCRKIKKNVKFSQKYALNISMRGVLDTINKSKTHDCERNLSPMILIGNQMVYS